MVALINSANITLSIYNNPALKAVAKHEIGHALGLNHANFKGNLMSKIMDSGVGAISKCEIEGVLLANNWKLWDNSTLSYGPPEDYVLCNDKREIRYV